MDENTSKAFDTFIDALASADFDYTVHETESEVTTKHTRLHFFKQKQPPEGIEIGMGVTSDEGGVSRFGWVWYPSHGQEALDKIVAEIVEKVQTAEAPSEATVEDA